MPAIAALVIPELGGEIATVIDVPILFEAALKSIRRIGHCYGFALDNQANRGFVPALGGAALWRGLSA